MLTCSGVKQRCGVEWRRVHGHMDIHDDLWMCLVCILLCVCERRLCDCTVDCADVEIDEMSGAVCMIVNHTWSAM